MKKFFLSPLCAPTFVFVMMTLFYITAYSARSSYGVFDIEELGVSEVLTYFCYFLSGLGLLFFFKDYLRSPKQKTFFALVFLWLITLFREMGAQKWLTQHDSTAIKIRFFTNPNNPWYEKVVAGALILIVLSVVLWLVIKYFKKMMIGFFQFHPLYWTIATFGGLGIVTQFTDRFPANYAKYMGTKLGEPVRFACKILEEGGEALLPILFLIALIQYHLIRCKKISQSGGESTNTVPDSV